MNPDSQLRKWWVLFVVCLIIFLINVDLTAVNLAVAKIADSLHTNLSMVQWVINAFVLASAVFFIPGGRFGDLYGRKPFVLAGIFLFMIVSICAGFSQNIWQLIASRAGQGIAFAFILPLMAPMLFSVFPPNERGRALGIYISTVGVGQALGPTLGGFIIHLFNWPAIFFINVPICVLTLIVGFFVLPNSKAQTNQKMDYLGLFLLVVGLTAIFLGLNEEQQFGIYSWILLALGFLELIFFYWIEKNIKSPIVNFSLFKNRVFVGISINRLIIQGVFFIILFSIPLLLQNIFSYSVYQTGIMLLAMTVFMGVMAPLTGKIIDKLGVILPVNAGLVVLLVGLIWLTQITFHSTVLMVIVPLAMLGMSFGLIIPALNYIVTSAVVGEEQGQAMGIFYTIGTLGSAISLALMTLFISLHSKVLLAQYLATQPITVSHSQQLILKKAVSGVVPVESLSADFSSTLVPNLELMVKEIFIRLFTDVMAVGAIFTVLMLIFIFFTLRTYVKPSH